MVPGRKGNQGFTLIELMLVAAIVGLLAAIAVPKFVNLIDKAREAALKGQFGALRSALQIYYADNEGIYPHFNSLGMDPIGPGIWTLDGKYIDLAGMVFIMPRYVVKLGGVERMTGMAYKPHYWPGGNFWWNSWNHMSFNMDPVDRPVHSVSPFPSYWVWATNGIAGGPGLHAHIGTNAIDSSNPPSYALLDTSGRAWSLW